MIAPLSARNERPTVLRGALMPPRGDASAAAASDLDAEQQDQIATQRQAFDYDAAERAEIMREHELLEALLMAQLKNEDEVTKKWIALI